ncbi:poly(A)-specific ribonuclease [Coemansia sp. RSA 2711]|nr:poly(A)-specific ribonuclease [Coemansia sp. RSA 2711]
MDWGEFTQNWDGDGDVAWPLLAVAARADSELVYTGDGSGRVTTYTLGAAGAALDRVSSVRCAQSAVRRVQPLPRGRVFVQSDDAVQVATDGGRRQRRWATTPNDAFVGAGVDGDGRSAFVCTAAGAGTLLDLEAGAVVRRAGVEPAAGAVHYSGGAVVLGTGDGMLAVRDPRAALRVVQAATVGAGPVLDLAVHAQRVYVCAAQAVRVYDVRKLAQPARVVTCEGQPTRLWAGAADLWVACEEGFVETRTLASEGADAGAAFVEPALGEYAFISALAAAPSERVALVADTEGVLHVWADSEEPRLSTGRGPDVLDGLDLDSDFGGGPAFDDERVSLAYAGTPADLSAPLLSRMDAAALCDVGRPVNYVDAAVSGALKTLGGVGYAANPRAARRNQQPFGGPDWRRRWHGGAGGARDDRELTQGRPKFLSQQRRHGSRPAADRAEPAEPSSANSSAPPKHLQQMRIEYSRFGVEDFDFSLYNATAWSGLEGNVRNAYANALLQLLFFSGELRQLALAHCAGACADALCLSCQLGLLFRMLATAQGASCHASQLLQVLAQRPEAAALGLLEDAHGHVVGAYAVLARRLLRFVLEQATVECRRLQQPDARLVERVFGAAQQTTTLCPACRATSARESHVFAVDLDAPGSGSSGLAAALAGGSASVRRAESRGLSRQRAGFLDLVSRALARTDTQRAWCAQCKKFQLLTTDKRIMRAPEAYLALNFPPAAGEGEGSGSNPWQMTLPLSFALRVSAADTRALPDDDDAAHGEPRLELAAVVSSVRDTRRGPDHLVVHVRDPDDAARWLLLNDFLVQRVPVASVAAFHDWWRLPAIAVYARPDRHALQAAVAAVTRSHPYRISTRILTAPRSALDTQPPPVTSAARNASSSSARMRNAAVPLSKAEAESLERGTFRCALDAEFVVLEDAIMEVFSDGTRHMLRPPVHVLARLSAVRANPGDLHGVPFIDDYVAISRPVFDLATQYSGIHAGDLTVGLSPYRLSTMKEVYKKLRLLVDCNCVIIGHGLKHDFRVCNIVVPPALQRDTMLLFQSPSHIRPISLRFLYWYFSRKSIQTREHSSVEDAQATLKVFESYALCVAADRGLESVLDDIYSVGASMSWKLPDQKF